MAKYSPALIRKNPTGFAELMAETDAKMAKARKNASLAKSETKKMAIGALSFLGGASVVGLMDGYFQGSAAVALQKGEISAEDAEAAGTVSGVPISLIASLGAVGASLAVSGKGHAKHVLQRMGEAGVAYHVAEYMKVRAIEYAMSDEE